jgi:chaperone BCS1
MSRPQARRSLSHGGERADGALADSVTMTHDGAALLVRCGSSVADDVARYAAHLLVHGRPATGTGADGDAWTTPRSQVRLEATGVTRDHAGDKRTTVFRPAAGTWRFVDPSGRRFRMEMRVNTERPVPGDLDPRLHWEATLWFEPQSSSSSSPPSSAPVAVSGGGDENERGGAGGRGDDAHEAFVRLIADAHKHAEPRSVDRVVIKRWAGTHWMRHARPAKRPLETLFLPEGTVERVVDDVREFLDGEADYARFGRPYKRVYMLSGAPGLGKSSLAMATAGRFDLDLYVYAVDDESTDRTLADAVVGLDAPCVLLIEDIDAAGGAKSRLTLSGLTNVLDGAQTRHGVLVFLTTNHPERLDAALTRSGRVDVWVRFDAATAGQIVAMVRHYFAPQFGLATPADSAPAALTMTGATSCTTTGPPGASLSGTGDDDDDDGNENDGGGGDCRLYRRRRKALDEIAHTLALRRVSAAALSEFLFARRRSPDIVRELRADLKTIGRRPIGGSSAATHIGSVDGARDHADVSFMYA